MNLKEQLQYSVDNDYAFLPTVDTAEVLHALGSTDPELRDTLAYSCLATWIVRGKYPKAQISHMLEHLLSDEVLFAHIAEGESDHVFLRSFAILIVTAMLYGQPEHQHLTAFELQNIHHKLRRYAVLEQDTRGYVLHKGWAHTSAHLADAMDELVKLGVMGGFVALETALQLVLKAKHAYICLETERIANIVLSACTSEKLAFEAWFEQIEENYTEIKALPYPEAVERTQNLKNFLKDCYMALLLTPEIPKHTERLLQLQHLLGSLG